MHADLKESLKNVNKYWQLFEHKNKPMTKPEVIAVLKYGISKGYETTE